MKKYLKKTIAITLLSMLVISPIVQASLSQEVAGRQAVGLGLTSVLIYAIGAPAIVLSGGLALGVLGGLILLNANDGTSSTPANSPLTINLNPNVPLTTPDGWTPPVPPSKQPTPPTTTTSKKTFSAANSGPQTTPEAAFPYFKAAVWPNHATSEPRNCNYETGTCTYDVIDVGTNYSFTTTVNNSCPQGYSLNQNSTICNISNPSQVTKPQKDKMEITREGNNFVLDPLINPADVIDPSIVDIQTNQIKINHADGSKTTIKLNTDGTSEVNVTQPNSNNTTTSTTSKFSAPDGTTGDVKSVGSAQSVKNGTGDLEGTPSTGGVSGTPIEFPDDYNLELTQREIKALLANGSNTPVDLTTQKTDYDTKASAHEAKYKSIGDGGLDAHGLDFEFAPQMMPSATCVPPVAVIQGHTVSFDFCDKVNFLKEILSWVFYIITAWTIFGIFTSKRD